MACSSVYLKRRISRPKGVNSETNVSHLISFSGEVGIRGAVEVRIRCSRGSIFGISIFVGAQTILLPLEGFSEGVTAQLLSSMV